MKVLVVSPSFGAPAWNAPDGRKYRVVHAASPAVALEQQRRLAFDAIVIDNMYLTDADPAAKYCQELEQLRREAEGAAVLALVGTTRETELPARTISADGLLPAHAPGHVQAQILFWAVEKVRLGTALRRRTTDWEQRSDELAQTQARFRDVIERNADAIVVVDVRGMIRFVNAAAVELFQRRRDDLIGTAFGYPMVAGETTELDLWRGGQTRIVEMRVVESEWEGEAACIASLRDITERRQAEEAARTLIREQAARSAAEQAAQRFRFLAEAGRTLAASLECDQTFAALARLCVGNMADWVAIYAAQERGALECVEVLHRDPARAEASARLRKQLIDPSGTHPVLRVIATREPLLVPQVDDDDLAALTQDATHRDLLRELGLSSLMIVPLVGRSRCVGAIAFACAHLTRHFDENDLAQARDLAQRTAVAIDNARLYQEAQEANRAKSDLLAVISHDLRTPLNAIIGYAELLEIGITDTLSAAGLERVGRIRASARHLLYLIDELLSFARLDAGHERLHLQEIDARVLAREIAVVLEPLAQKRGLRLFVDRARTPVMLCTDPDKLRQVLLNIAANAVKYTDEGTVRIGVSTADDGSVVLSVSDSGPGIHEDHLSHIFEPFWQVTATRGSPDGGTGLGLSVVQRLVKLLGGEIAVESVVGDGSTFSVRLPRHHESETMNAAGEPERSQHTATVEIG